MTFLLLKMVCGNFKICRKNFYVARSNKRLCACEQLYFNIKWEVMEKGNKKIVSVNVIL